MKHNLNRKETLFEGLWHKTQVMEMDSSGLLMHHGPEKHFHWHLIETLLLSISRSEISNSIGIQLYILTAATEPIDAAICLEADEGIKAAAGKEISNTSREGRLWSAQF